LTSASDICFSSLELLIIDAVRRVKPFLNSILFACLVVHSTDISSHIGKAKKEELQIQKAGAFESDIQILDFLNTLTIDSEAKKDSDAATRWFNCFCLMAELGLRPIKMNFFSSII